MKKLMQQMMVWGVAVHFSVGCYSPQTHFEPNALPLEAVSDTSFHHLPQHLLILDHVKQLTATYHNWTIQHRRHLHMYPELSGEEAATQRYIMTQLDSLGIGYQIDVGIGYSIVAEIKGGRNRNNRKIMLRADTNALPINEKNDVSYKSKNAGVSHKCGHDFHASNLLCVSRVLNDLQEALTADYILVWQPHEEALPGGAKPMVEAGILEGVHACIGLHVDPMLEVGTIGLKSGSYMASIDQLSVKYCGKGAHGGSGVHMSKNPILAMAYLLTSLEQVKAHNCPATTPMALSFGHIEGGKTYNVIPDTCTAKGTFRALDDQWRSQAHQRMLDIAKGVGQSTGVQIDFDIQKGHPVLVNDPMMAALAKSCAETAIGALNVVELGYWLASEDFSHYSKAKPSIFIRCGVRNEQKGMTHGLHTAMFDIDEDAFLTAATVMAWTAICAGEQD